MPFEHPKPKKKSFLKRWLERRETYWKIRREIWRRKKERSR